MIRRSRDIPEVRILVWLGIALAAVALLTLTAPILASFSDLFTIFFLSWLLAFLIRPLAVRLSRLFGSLPYGTAVALSYILVGLATALVITAVAVSLVQSVVDLTSSQMSLADALVARLAPLQAKLDAAGFAWIQPGEWLRGALSAVDFGSSQVIGTVGSIVASVAGALGTLFIVVFLSVYIAADRDRLVTEVHRLVPARYQHALTVSQQAVGRSFDGFIRGQVVMGLMFGAVAFVASEILGLPYAPLIGFTVAILQTIPYFGQFVSWAPPVLVALLYQPDAALPMIIVMVVALLVLANVVQPRVLGGAVGLSPLGVLAAVLIGGKVAGVLGAVFSVPVAAAAFAIIHELRVTYLVTALSPDTTDPQTPTAEIPASTSTAATADT